MAQEKNRWISGFWRRLVAFFLDGMVLAVAGYGAGLFLEDVFVGMGAWGRLLGFAVALLYFGVLNSSVTRGQTPGKVAMKIRVVDSENSPINLPRSFGRYAVLGLPYFLNGARLPQVEGLYYPMLVIVSIIVFGGSFAIIYLYIFNRATRQSLHDLVCGTYVVAAAAQREAPGRVWRPHLVVVALLLAAAACAPFVASRLFDQTQFAALNNSRAVMVEDPMVVEAVVADWVTVASPENIRSLNAMVFLRKDRITDKGLAHALAGKLAGSYPGAREKDMINISLIYGYDIGIHAKSKAQLYQFKPDEFGRST